jgi:arylsulfatase A-like enzyme
MHRENSGFHSGFASLWFRLVCIALVSSIFAEALLLASGKAQGWTYYLTGPEVAFEVVVRLIGVALAGVALATIAAAVIWPFFWHFETSRERLAHWATTVCVVLAVYLDSRFALKILIKQSNLLAGWPVTVLFTVHFLAFAAVLCIPQGRREVASSLDGFLGEKMTRRTVIATGIGTVALVATEFAFGKIGATVGTTVQARPVPRRAKSNILLITFDALSAEDMSLYGYRLPTTPNIDSFGRTSTVFTNFFSGSTLTTPCVATILTGLHPSESHVYHLQGRVRSPNSGRSLPHLMRAAGYTTAAAISSPYAYYFAEGLANDYDSLPETAFHDGGMKHLWDATRPLHQRSPIGSRIEEYLDFESAWDFVPVKMGRSTPGVSQQVRPDKSFKQAREVLGKLPDGFFLWVHVMAPHFPYLPDSADLGRFLASRELLTFFDQYAIQPNSSYGPGKQSVADKIRLRYDEYIATADRAFGSFISELEGSGRLRDTTVIVSADHGDSFEGGFLGHGGPFQTRPVIHIPLIIRTPDQRESRRIAFAADQTALAPTILDLAGQSKPEWMPGRSLVGWLNGDSRGEGEGLAFTQNFERSSLFAPLRSGTIGVIDGRYQYILNLATQKGMLRRLNEAQIKTLDRSAENPALVRMMRAAIYSRFPDLPRKTA